VSKWEILLEKITNVDVHIKKHDVLYVNVKKRNKNILVLKK